MYSKPYKVNESYHLFKSNIKLEYQSELNNPPNLTLKQCSKSALNPILVFVIKSQSSYVQTREFENLLQRNNFGQVQFGLYLVWSQDVQQKIPKKWKNRGGRIEDSCVGTTLVPIIKLSMSEKQGFRSLSAHSTDEKD